MNPVFRTGDFWYRVVVWSFFTVFAAAAMLIGLYILTAVLFTISELLR